MTAKHTPGPWRLGKSGGSVVADAPVPEISGSEAVEHYGGHLIAESIAPQNQPLIAAAPDLLLAARATLLFHSAAHWTDSERGEWNQIAYALLGRTAQERVYEATTRMLCDMQRAAIAKAERGTP